jgi:hypothetical protein
MNYKGFGKERHSPIKILSRDFAVGMKTTTKHFSLALWCPGRDSNQEIPEYRATEHRYISLLGVPVSFNLYCLLGLGAL